MVLRDNTRDQKVNTSLVTVSCHGVEGPMTSGYYCAIFPFCGGGKKKKKKKKRRQTRPCEQGNWDTWMVLDPWNQV